MASNTPMKNRLDQVAAEQKLVDGLNKHAQAITSFVTIKSGAPLRPAAPAR
jgi:hypothetical protein